MKFNTHTMKLLVLSVCAAFVIGACSSNGADTTPQQPTTAPAAPPTTTPPPQPNVETEPAEEPAPAEQNIGPVDVVDTLANRGNFTQLVAAIQAAGLEEKLRSAGPYTIFAPTDDAFAALSPDILSNGDLVFDILLYHVVEGQLGSGDVANQSFITTLLGDDLGVTVDGSNIRLDGALVTTIDVAATNGVVHVIDSVLIPPSSGLLDSSLGVPVAMVIPK